MNGRKLKGTVSIIDGSSTSPGPYGAMKYEDLYIYPVVKGLTALPSESPATSTPIAAPLL
eukprot:CAMPEP_0197540808 /NCGR_PEP_ID=MMETSP1318-20131121/66808_1 /TAXON_ID=552666 /ORGANISM="Partenskyella glossopodia, Strain RCC365" /LENGTH=59 /DNA_ID=CAMNT_0043099909 /DNA_START=162 /DNA_END=341 /DNA_ORIENTATION=+